jgi:drug/metabolite transporter (DMT)-like permease
MFSLLIALAIRSERFRVRRIAGTALGVTALMLLAIPELRLPDAGMAPLLLLGLFAPFCYGMEGNIVERLAPVDAGPVAVIFASSVLATPVAGILAWQGGTWVDLTGPWAAAEWALLGSSLGHALAYTGYVALVGLAGAVFSSQIAYIVTLAAIVVSLVFLGETYPATAWIAIALMMGGLMLVQPAGHMPQGASTPSPGD